MRGFVYLLGNIAMPTYYKIGMTTRDPYERAKQLSAGTGVPLDFRVGCFIEVLDAQFEERFLHQFLADFRTNCHREFFQFARVHMPWVFGLFRFHPRAVGYGRGKYLMGVFPGWSEDFNPWAGRQEPSMTEYSPEHAIFAPDEEPA